MPREECGIRGPRATCRLGWSRRGRKLTDAVAASRSRRSRPSARSSHERSCAKRSRTAQGDAMATRSARGTPRVGQQHSSDAGLSRPIPKRPGSLPGSLCRVGPKETSMVLHDGRRARSAADDPILAALAVGAGQQHGHTARRAPAMRPSTRAPLHPERGVALHPRVRDRAREGRNGKAGSSEADEPGPKGDAQLSSPFIETSDATQVVASGQALADRNPLPERIE